jgi:Grx4 family monothiol glutaredoxin
VHNVSSVPTVLFFAGTKEINRLVGANPQELNRLIAEFSSNNQIIVEEKSNNNNTGNSIVIETPTNDLDSRLKALIIQHKVMGFIKGTPSSPQCGFSRKFCEILQRHGVQFDTFNILSDQEVREGLKKFSNWPTYPQLYVNGELVGGLDIINELVEAEEFLDLFK